MNSQKKSFVSKAFFAVCALLLTQCVSFAGEADLIVPDFSKSPQNHLILVIGIIVSVLGLIFAPLIVPNMTFGEYDKIYSIPREYVVLQNPFSIDYIQ